MNMSTLARFTWLWGEEFFLETENGNFIWSSPSYGGDNTIRPCDKSLEEYCQLMNLEFGRDKGQHEIEKYCGNKVRFVEG
jgi:hypothetical protein